MFYISSDEFSLDFLGSLNRLLVLLTAGLMLFLGNVGYRQNLSFRGSSALLIGKCESFILDTESFLLQVL